MSPTKIASIVALLGAATWVADAVLSWGHSNVRGPLYWAGMFALGVALAGGGYALVASGAGVIVNVGSTAGRIAYEGGAGYTAAKHGTQVVTETLRLELYDQPVRVCEIAPGMVRTDEFALVRFGGDKQKADSVYAGVAEPLVAEDIADAIAWVVTRPPHVNIDELVIRPRAQAAQHKVHRVFD